MRNQYKERERQIEKSVNGDWTQNVNYHMDKYKIREKREKKKSNPRLTFKNGKLIRTDSYNNGVPFTWEDKV